MLAALLSNVYVAAIVIVFFGVTIFVHELGHYLVARWCGLVVEVFSIGFGPAIWKKKVNGITYKIGWIPFGGYVALPQLDPAGMEAIQGKPDQKAEDDAPSKEPTPFHPRVAPWKKILVSLAGVTGNMILAVIIAWVVFLVGMPATTANQDSVLGYVDPGSVAHEQGLRAGDRITEVNGIGVTRWSEFIQESSMYDSVDLDFVAAADGMPRKAAVPTEEWQYGVRMVAGVDSKGACIVGDVDPGMAAAKAGIVKDDVIVGLAGKAVLSKGHLIQLVATNRGQSVPIQVERVVGDETVTLSMEVKPEFDPAEGMPRIGISFKRGETMVDSSAKIHPRPTEQIKFHASTILRFLRDLVTPKKAARAANMVGGPVAIITYYVGIIKASLMLAVWFTGFLNVNLAIINLLPIPVLDGGHIVFSLWEWITRRPMKARVVNVLVNIFVVLLIGVFVLLSIRDIGRHTPLSSVFKRLFQRSSEGGEIQSGEDEPLDALPEPEALGIE